MVHFRTSFLLSLLFAVVLVISSRASADNQPAGVAQTQGGAQMDDHGGGGGGGWGGGGRGGGHHCRYPHCKEGVHGDETETETYKSGHKPYKPIPKN